MRLRSARRHSGQPKARGALFGVAVAACLLWTTEVGAFPQYRDGCSGCHGDFDGPVSPKGSLFPADSKHEMHRGSAYMSTECLLCHTQVGDNPQIGSSAGTANNTGYGCTGCHGRLEDEGGDLISPGRGAGLRQHHTRAGVGVCGMCHTDVAAPPTPVAENTKPPYYGTPDTRVDMPCNPVAGSNINENWTVGDFDGLDNDGDGLRDAADPDCGAGTSTTTTPTTSTTSTTLWVPVAGKKLLIKNKVPDDEAKNKISFVAKDAAITAPAVGSAGDPRCTQRGGGGSGGTLIVSSQTSGQSHTTSLPCDNWRLIGKHPGPGNTPKGYKYGDKELDDGTCKIVILKNEKLLKATCLGRGPTTLDYDLQPGQTQSPVNVILTTGALSHCAQFGGEIKKDGADGKVFKAVASAPPPSCP